MPITRREFTAVTTSTVVLTVLGCDGQAESGETNTSTAGKSKKDDKPKLADKPFLVGPPSRYRQAGVYHDYHKDFGVWMVSNGRTLIALSGVCTHLACMTELNQEQEQFQCPCHESRFGLDGIQLEGSKAKRPLERCALRLVDRFSGEQIEVDPTRRFRQDKDQWSDPASSMVLG